MELDGKSHWLKKNDRCSKNYLQNKSLYSFKISLEPRTIFLPPSFLSMSLINNHLKHSHLKATQTPGNLMCIFECFKTFSHRLQESFAQRAT